MGPSEVDGLSRITVVVDADAELLEQITKQLNKLINVIKIIELAPENSVQRDHLLIKVKADSPTRLQVTQAVDLFRAKIVDVSVDSLTIEATGAPDKLNALLEVLELRGARDRPFRDVGDQPRLEVHDRSRTALETCNQHIELRRSRSD